jgi:hypothetical protein
MHVRVGDRRTDRDETGRPTDWHTKSLRGQRKIEPGSAVYCLNNQSPNHRISTNSSATTPVLGMQCFGECERACTCGGRWWWWRERERFIERGSTLFGRCGSTRTAPPPPLFVLESHVSVTIVALTPVCCSVLLSLSLSLSQILLPNMAASKSTSAAAAYLTRPVNRDLLKQLPAPSDVWAYFLLLYALPPDRSSSRVRSRATSRSHLLTLLAFILPVCASSLGLKSRAPRTSWMRFALASRSWPRSGLLNAKPMPKAMW